MIRHAFDEDSAADIAFENHQERLAEERDERRRGVDEQPEQPDAQGRTADWNWPRGYGGDKSVPW